jgi:hypothetical protein
MQEMKGEEYNEITVEDEGTVEDYGQYCSDLLSVSTRPMSGPRNTLDRLL